MWKSSLYSLGGLAMVLIGTSAANAAGAATMAKSLDHVTAGVIVQRVHSVDEAEDTLRDRGFYDAELERASLPYSFTACKRGVRYHIHVDDHGDLIQVDEAGSCGDEGDGHRQYGRDEY